MAKKDKNKMLLVLGLVAGFFLLRPKSSQAQRNYATNVTSNTESGAKTNDTITNTPNTKVENNTLTGPQELKESVLYPSQINNFSEKENARGINWNFGMIAKTRNIWAGETTSTTWAKAFINRFAGLAALLYLLFVYMTKRKLTTIQSIGNTWAANNKERWIEKVSEFSGFAPNEPLKPDSSFLFPLAYAIALYYQPQAREYISTATMMSALDYVQKNYKINIQ
jgi:hypothetical protein